MATPRSASLSRLSGSPSKTWAPSTVWTTAIFPACRIRMTSSADRASSAPIWAAPDLPLQGVHHFEQTLEETAV